MADKRLTSTRVAEILGVTASSIKRWADDGLLVCELTAGGHRRFLASEVARFRRQESENPVARLASLTDVELDALPYGVVGLDDEGVVTRYNATEAKFTHLSADQVIGHNFFTEIAKCTNNSLVMGRFFKGVSARNLDEKIFYTFTYVMRPTNVLMHLIRCPKTHSNWVLVYHNLDSAGIIDDSE